MPRAPARVGILVSRAAGCQNPFRTGWADCFGKIGRVADFAGGAVWVEPCHFTMPAVNLAEKRVMLRGSPRRGPGPSDLPVVHVCATNDPIVGKRQLAYQSKLEAQASESLTSKPTRWCVVLVFPEVGTKVVLSN